MSVKKLRRAIPAAICMMILIFETKTAILGVRNGIEVCLYRLIPSIFPFLFLSRLLISAMTGSSIKLLRAVGERCRIPYGSESLLAVGLFGGYPVGAGNVADQYRCGTLTRSDASRMAVFCNNAGPSFLFGVLGPLFAQKKTLWQLWAIHGYCAILCGMLLPGGNTDAVRIPQERAVSLTECLAGAVKTMGLICGWVVLFRMIQEFLDRWFMWYVPEPVAVLLTGFLELSNGCIGLEQIGSEDLRFVLASAMLSFGGICVWMQTASLCDGLDLRLYLPGKLIQACVSAAISGVVVLTRRLSNPTFSLLLLCGVFLIPIFVRKQVLYRKKEVAI